MTAESREKYRASPETVARVLLLIDTFSHSRGGSSRQLEGRVKLAKLDFLLRYPHHLSRILEIRGVREAEIASIESASDSAPIDSRMMRYRYGPWDPAYYAILGSLIGRGLVQTLPLPTGKGVGFRTTDAGATLAVQLRADGAFASIEARALTLRKHLDKSGTTLKNLIYRLPEVATANWKDELE